MIDDLSGQALRVLAIATRPVASLPYSEDENLSVDEKFKKSANSGNSGRAKSQWCSRLWAPNLGLHGGIPTFRVHWCSACTGSARGSALSASWLPSIRSVRASGIFSVFHLCCIVFRVFRGFEWWSRLHRFRKNLSLVGLVASIDPEREGVRESIEEARGAHVSHWSTLHGERASTRRQSYEKSNTLQPKAFVPARVDFRHEGHFL